MPEPTEAPVKTAAPKAATKPLPRDPREVINDAILENRSWERVCLGLVVGFSTVGLALAVTGAALNNGLVSLSGTLFGALFWPAFRSASNTKKENQLLRLLEITLGKAGTSKEAAEAIREAFLSRFQRGKVDVPVVRAQAEADR
jgi:hypothetical protein